MRSVKRDREELVEAARELRTAAAIRTSLGAVLVAEGLHWRWLMGGLAFGLWLGSQKR